MFCDERPRIDHNCRSLGTSDVHLDRSLASGSEPTYIVVQLARFFILYFPFYDFTARCYRKSLRTPYLAHAQIYGSSVLQLAGLHVVGDRLALRVLYSCSQLCMLLACMYKKQPVLTSCSTPPSFFAVH